VKGVHGRSPVIVNERLGEASATQMGRRKQGGVKGVQWRRGITIVVVMSSNSSPGDSWNQWLGLKRFGRRLYGRQASSSLLSLYSIDSKDGRRMHGSVMRIHG
jgi:hypothetical protein